MEPPECFGCPWHSMEVPRSSPGGSSHLDPVTVADPISIHLDHFTLNSMGASHISIDPWIPSSYPLGSDRVSMEANHSQSVGSNSRGIPRNPAQHHYLCEGPICRHCGQDFKSSDDWWSVEGRVCPVCYKEKCIACPCQNVWVSDDEDSHENEIDEDNDKECD